MGTGGLSRVLQRRGSVRGRMAGAGAWPACAAGPRHRAALRGRAPPRAARGARRGWRALGLAVALLVLSDAHAQIVSSRIWPARDYTRLTLESKSAVKHSMFSVKDPERLVLDLKADVKPQLFNLPPVAEYGHRLVLDIYPAVPLDPLAALLEESSKTQEKEKPASSVARLATIVIDAGHGGGEARHAARRLFLFLRLAA